MYTTTLSSHACRPLCAAELRSGVEELVRIRESLRRTERTASAAAGHVGSDSDASVCVNEVRGNWSEVIDLVSGRTVYYSSVDHTVRMAKPGGWVRMLAGAIDAAERRNHT